MSEKHWVLTLDIEKTFDTIQIVYMQNLLKLGFGPKFLRTMTALYPNPKAYITMNNMWTDEFAIARGTRQDGLQCV